MLLSSPFVSACRLSSKKRRPVRSQYVQSQSVSPCAVVSRQVDTSPAVSHMITTGTSERSLDVSLPSVPARHRATRFAPCSAPLSPSSVSAYSSVAKQEAATRRLGVAFSALRYAEFQAAHVAAVWAMPC